MDDNLDKKVFEEFQRDFDSWKRNKITKLILKKMREEVDEKMSGLVWDSYDNPEIVKGYIRAYTNIVGLTAEELL